MCIIHIHFLWIIDDFLGFPNTLSRFPMLPRHLHSPHMLSLSLYCEHILTHSLPKHLTTTVSPHPPKTITQNMLRYYTQVAKQTHIRGGASSTTSRRTSSVRKPFEEEEQTVAVQPLLPLNVSVHPHPPCMWELGVTHTSFKSGSIAAERTVLRVRVGSSWSSRDTKNK